MKPAITNFLYSAGYALAGSIRPLKSIISD
jgi:hypothetical protein